MCLHVPNGASNVQVEVRDCNPSDPNQRWTYWRPLAGGDRIRFGDGSVQKCLTGNPSANGNAATVTTCTTTGVNQGWDFMSVPGHIRMSGGVARCLDVAAQTDADYLSGIGYPRVAGVQMWDCLPVQRNQKWNFTGQIKHKETGNCLRLGVSTGNLITHATCIANSMDSASDWDFYPIVEQL